MRSILSILIALIMATTVRSAEPQAQQQAAAPTAVLVLPFTMLGGDGKYEWIGQGIQQNLQAELGRTGLDVVGTLTVKPMNMLAVQPKDEVDAALKAAAEARADVVIFGNYQVSENDLRITGRIIDVASGQNVGFIKVNGTVRDVLGLEDQVAAQTLNAMNIVQAPEQGARQHVEAPAAEVERVEAESVQQQEPVIYEPESYVSSTRYYDDDIDDIDWISAAYSYPTYYPAAYVYYPTYSYYRHCYRPWYYRPSYYCPPTWYSSHYSTWSPGFSIGFGFSYSKYRSNYYHHHHDRYAYHRGHDHDRHRYSHYRSSGHHDRGSRFRDGRDDRDGWRREDRSPRRTILASDRRTEDNDKTPRRTTLAYRPNSERRGGSYVTRGSDHRMPTVGGAKARAGNDDARASSAERGERPRVVQVPKNEAKNDAIVKGGSRPDKTSDRTVVRIDGNREQREAPQRETPRETRQREPVRVPAREPVRVVQRDPNPARAAETPRRSSVAERAPSRGESSRVASSPSRRESAPVRSSPSVRSSSSGRSSAAISSRGSDSGSRSSGSSFRSSSSSSRSGGGSSASSSRSSGGGGSRGGGRGR